MKDAKNKKFVCRVNGYSIYWSNRYAKKDAYRFILIKNGRQNYDTSDLFGAISHAMANNTPTKDQKKKFIKYAKEHDPESVDLIKRRM